MKHGHPDAITCPLCRIEELEAVIKESIRNHRCGCPCPRCSAVIPQPTFEGLE